AILDLRNGGTPRGLLLPRMTTIERTNLALSLGAAQVGMIVVDTTTNDVYLWNGVAWVSLSSGGDLLGTGTAGYLSRWTAGSVLGNSIIRDDGLSLGIGAAPAPAIQLNLNTVLGRGIQVSSMGANTTNYGVYAATEGA